MNFLATLSSSGLLSGQPAETPVDPGRDQAQQWLRDELSNPRYAEAQPTWFDRLANAVNDWLNSLSFNPNSLGLPHVPTIVALLLVLCAAAVLGYLVFGPPRLGRRATTLGALFGSDDQRDSDALRHSAEAAARAGDWAIATEEMFRAIARGLDERTIISVTPGTTAQGFARLAENAFSDFGERIRLLASHFDEVRYLGALGSQSHYRDAAALESALRATQASTLRPIGAR